MHGGRVFVLLPCHTLDDFPTWLEEDEADQLLAAWTAAWHPAIIAAAGGPPGWSSVDLPPPADAVAGVVPAFCDERFAAQANPDDQRRWVRELTDSDAIAAALAERITGGPPAGTDLAGAGFADDFRALGLGVLLAELLARRMRMEADLATTGLTESVLAAARAAVAGDDEATRSGLAESFRCLESTRSRYYAVESFAVDHVLLAPATLGRPLLEELRSPVPLAVIATGETVRLLAERHGDAAAALREAVAAGRVEVCGGRHDARPLDTMTPEAIRGSLLAGRTAWVEAVGTPPVCSAAIGGGSSAILPQLLAGLGYRAAIWTLFDGTPVPDPGGGRIRWEGTGNAAVEAIARPPLDAGRAASVLELPDRIGDVLDHDHAAVIQFAHYAGKASRWHRLVRRIGGASSLLGTFLTPSNVVERTASSGTPASFEPDAFAVTPLPAVPPGRADAAASALATAAVAAIEADARDVAAAAGGWRDALAEAPRRPGVPARAARANAGGRRWLPSGLLGRRRDDDTLLLDNGLIELRPHPRSGGLLSLRRPADRGNRISQQLAVRTTVPAATGRWSPPEDRAEYGRMEADGIIRDGTAGNGRVESRGRLVAADGRRLGRFVQAMTLASDLPLAVIEIEVELEQPIGGPLDEAHVACRFAWHENEDVELRRSLHLQSITTERTRFTAPHFIEIVPERGRTTAGSDAVTILTGGLPWHVRSSPHVLDSVLVAEGPTVRRRLAVGIGIDRPWDAAVALAAGDRPAVGPPLPANVRLTGEPPAPGDPPGRLRLGLVESAGRSGEVRIAWGHPVSRAEAVDSEGRPRHDLVVSVAGRETIVPLARYEWLRLVLDFAPAERAVAPLEPPA